MDLDRAVLIARFGHRLPRASRTRQTTGLAYISEFRDLRRGDCHLHHLHAVVGAGAAAYRAPRFPGCAIDDVQQTGTRTRASDTGNLIWVGLLVVLVAVGILVAGALLAQGAPVGLDWGILWTNRFLLLQGAATTIALAVLAAFFGTLIGLLVALVRVAHVPFLAQY